MKIAILQFSPCVGEVAKNFSRAESLLMREEREGMLSNLDLLVLPEMAFTGYNFSSLSMIAPFLEPTAAGPSTRWASRTAKRLQCTVAVGYPESAVDGNYNTIFDDKIQAAADSVAYNSLVFVNAAGDVVAHYRKSFLFFTDEYWAKEGQGFYAGILPIGNRGQQVKAAAGICMDINPYKFEAPFTAYEFANHAREAQAKVVILSMAWLTRLSQEEIQQDPSSPDIDTLSYWVARFQPMVGSNATEQETIIICANRAGEEGTDPKIGEVRYAGSSCVIGMKKGGETQIWDISGRGQEGILLIDTRSQPKFSLARSNIESADPMMPIIKDLSALKQNSVHQ